MDGQAVLEEDPAGEVLEVRVLHPAGEHRLVGETVGMLQVHQPRHQAGMRGRPSFLGGEEADPFPLEPGPVDQRGQPDQLVSSIDQIDQARPQQVGLFRRAVTMLHAHQNRRNAAWFQPNPAIPERPSR